MGAFDGVIMGKRLRCSISLSSPWLRAVWCWVPRRRIYRSVFVLIAWNGPGLARDDDSSHPMSRCGIQGWRRHSQYASHVTPSWVVPAKASRLFRVRWSNWTVHKKCRTGGLTVIAQKCVISENVDQKSFMVCQVGLSKRCSDFWQR